MRGFILIINIEVCRAWDEFLSSSKLDEGEGRDIVKNSFPFTAFFADIQPLFSVCLSLFLHLVVLNGVNFVLRV